MITLTRLTGAPFALNPDLVERVDCTPDTVITLVDGTKYLVSQSLQEVTDLVLDYRSRVVAGASVLERNQSTGARRTLHAVHPSQAGATESAADDDSDDDTDDGGPGGRPGSVVALEPRTI